MMFVIGLFVGTFIGMMIGGLCRSIAVTEIEPLRYEQVGQVADLGDAA
jgi:hypothetical protein